MTSIEQGILEAGEEGDYQAWLEEIGAEPSTVDA
jgi:hypothetical protein